MLPTEISPTLEELREKKKKTNKFLFPLFVVSKGRERIHHNVPFQLRNFLNFFFLFTIQMLAIINKKTLSYNFFLLEVLDESM